MPERRAGDYSVFPCGRCGGVWVDNLVSQRLVRVYEHNVVFAAEEAARGATSAVDPRPAIGCPICGVLLGRVLVGVDGGVEVDACAAHGTWFDRDELSRVTRALTRPELLEVRTAPNTLGENAVNALRNLWRAIEESATANDRLDYLD